jgi:hypothetical protein
MLNCACVMMPTELEQALAAARAQHGKNKNSTNGNSFDRDGHGSGSRRDADNQAEDIHVVFEEPFTSRGGRKGGGMPLVCMGSGEHTVYVLQVIYNGRRWSVERRFSEFDLLDRELQRMWGFDPSVRLGELPSKVWVGKLHKETKSKRKDELELYISNLLSQSKLVQESAELRAFLEIPLRNDAGQGPPPVISRPSTVCSRRFGTCRPLPPLKPRVRMHDPCHGWCMQQFTPRRSAPFGVGSGASTDSDWRQLARAKQQQRTHPGL